MKKVGLYTLGCKLNFSETSAIGRQFDAHGYARVPFHDAADVYVINTCSVTDNADKKCRKVVRQALKSNPGAYVVVVGCYAQLKPQEIAGIPGVDLVLGAAEKFRLFEVVDDFVKSSGGKAIAGDIHAARGFVPAYSQGERTRSFLKIQDGCDYKCSFCTIPLARGRSRSDELDNIVANARALAGDGVREIVLTGVNIGDYRTGQGQKFIDVVRALDAVEGIDRIRISSIEPNLLSDEIIQFVAGSQRFMPHFHLPLQSGNDEMLLRMRRRYKRAVYEDRVATIKRLMPHACIGVDVITGHPGEGEDHFLDTCHFLERLDVSYLHVFTYSERAHTHALTLPHPVPQQVRNERTLQLRSLGEQKRRSFYAQHAGTRRPILFEEEVSEGSLHGFTDNYIKVTTPYDPLLVNEIRTFQLAAPDARGEMRIEADEVELAHPAIGAAATEG